MVHCGVSSPYLSLTYIGEGDYLGKSSGDYDAPRGYTMRRRDIGRLDTSTVSSIQPDDAIVRYGKGKSHA
jgi:hypothetical protein